MLNFLTKGLTGLFGTKTDKDLKELRPFVGLVTTEFEKLQTLTDDQLRYRTTELKAIIKEYLSAFSNEIAELKSSVANTPDMDIDDQQVVFNQIDKIELDANKALEDVLIEILPQAFAVIKETARRWKENGKMEVTATFQDKQLATRKKNVEIIGEKAIWYNTWLAAGNAISWEMVHYDVQLIGGVVLHQGKISEMATGEGKTLVATLPTYLNALAGKGVHIVTVNDYLAKRDCEWNAPLFEFHGLTVDCIDFHEPHTTARRNAYLSDITYGTNNEFGFDYLRDNMSRATDELVQRKHHFAIVDEVDSVLIDDARTPLIISGPVPRGDEHEFYELKPRIARLVDAQKAVCNTFLNDAKRLIAAGNTKEGGVSLFRAYRGLPKSKPLIKFLSEQGMRAVLQDAEGEFLAENQKRMPEADAPLYFVIEEKNNSVELTDKGIDQMTGESDDAHFFIMPDMATGLATIEKNTAINEQEKLHQKENLIRDYSIKTQRIHTVQQLLKAYTLFEKDTEYVIMDDKVLIVDEQTGRIMDGRRYSDGLHQAIEAKENVKVEDATSTYATVTLQNYFRMYHKLAGMTGTAETEAKELWDIYKLDVVTIPTNRGIVRKDEEDKIYKTVREKYNAAVQEISELIAAGRPILVGTTSVENSEIISRMLTLRKIPHQVLNAKQHAKEADVVALAGQPGTVTIATNMAGRGTDIKLTPESRNAGGLAIIGTERHESRRVDRQLRGRAGRQGDPGSSQFFVSLEDNLMRLFGSERIASVMDKMGMEEGEVIQHSMITSSIERAQKKVEENNFGTRKRLLEYDDVMNYQRDAIYKRRRNALFGERLSIDIANTLYDVASEMITNAGNDYDLLEFSTIQVFGIEPPFTKDAFGKLNEKQRTHQLYETVERNYHSKNQHLAEQVLPFFEGMIKDRPATAATDMVYIPFSDGEKMLNIAVNTKRVVETKGREVVREMEKLITLNIIDQEWKEHLRDMDDLKQSVQNAAYEQKDPLLVYKFESVEIFQRFLSRVNIDTIGFLVKAFIPVTENDIPTVATPAQSKKQEIQPKLTTNRHDDDTPPAVAKQMPVRSAKLPDRNQRVSVQYRDGNIKNDVKFKAVEDDVKRGLCILIG